ncbi:hypothetical protein KRP22_004813 [Phytophthora ramorum]|nr:hypothetical protein KRP22_10445 [Phytophthora ramorum]
MSYLHANEFVDTQTLLAFPTSAEHKTPSYSYRVIKWALLKARRRDGQKRFCYLEYAGVYCQRPRGADAREVRHSARTVCAHGILVTKRHQFNILKITAVAQVDGALVPAAVRLTMKEIMLDFVGGGLLELRPTAR